MNVEQAQQLTKQATEQLLTAVERGESEALSRYIAAMGRFHRYSFGNILLILSQRPDATRVAGFTAWKSHRRFVKKGEKGILIVAPMIFRKSDEDAPPDARNSDRPIVRFKGAHVFDVSQTDGEPLPEPVQVAGDPGDHTGRLKRFIAGQSIVLEYDSIASGAQGYSAGGRIVIAHGLSPAEEFSVLTHELAHEMLHRGEQRPSSKTVRETEAEAVAHIVCSAIGLNVGTACSDYIQLYNCDKDTLLESLGRIQRTASVIIDAVAEAPAPCDEPA